MLNELRAVGRFVADELSMSGGDVAAALDRNPFFRSNRRPQSALERSIVEAAIRKAIGRSEGRLDFKTVNGALELRYTDGPITHAFRLLRGHRDASGRLKLISNSSSMFARRDGAPTDENRLFDNETVELLHVIAFFLDANHQLEVLSSAPVDGFLAGPTGQLNLGTETPLFVGGGDSGGERFVGDDNDDLPFEEDEGFGEADS